MSIKFFSIAFLLAMVTSFNPINANLFKLVSFNPGYASAIKDIGWKTLPNKYFDIAVALLDDTVIGCISFSDKEDGDRKINCLHIRPQYKPTAVQQLEQMPRSDKTELTSLSISRWDMTQSLNEAGFNKYYLFRYYKILRRLKNEEQ